LVVGLVHRDDLLAVDATWHVSCFLSALDVSFDTSNAECVSALEGLCVFCDHGHLAVTAVGMTTMAAELLMVLFDDAMHEQDLDEDLTVLGSKVVERVALRLVVRPGQSFVEPVEASEANGWHVLAHAALAGHATHVLLLHILIGGQAGGRRCLLTGEVDVVALWVRGESGFCHDSEWVELGGVRAGWLGIRGRGRGSIRSRRRVAGADHSGVSLVVLCLYNVVRLGDWAETLGRWLPRCVRGAQGFVVVR